MHRKKRLSLETSSATIIDGNDDLLTEILVLLPAKSLIRFQLVSKHWRSLISDESFPDLRLHQRHSRRRQPQLSFILRTTGSQQFFICDLTAKTMVRLHFEWSHVKILQSSNGLLYIAGVPEIPARQKRNLSLQSDHNAAQGVAEKSLWRRH
ncbi:hypothetical protein C2S52_010720 [Perilla frutescens var. hirtella]|nr:hypothetical protein C2S52_010720 [Perilla frutescens var. hirtella]